MLTLDEFKKIHDDAGDVTAVLCIAELDRSYSFAFFDFMLVYPELHAYYRASPAQWLHLLQREPKFAQYCDWSQFTGDDWVQLLNCSPKFSQYCDWSTFDSSQMRSLLIRSPEYVNCCDLSKINRYCVMSILGVQPQLVGRFGRDQITKLTRDMVRRLNPKGYELYFEKAA